MNQETKTYLTKAQAAFPRLKLFAVKNSAGYQAIGKFGLLPEKPKTENKMENVEMNAVRNPNGKKLFACNGKPHWDGERWRIPNGKWIELPSTWRNDITFETSPKRIRGITPAR